MESSGSSSTKALPDVKVIGILSDTHDRADAAAAGIKALRAAGAEFLVHCGDVGGERILDLLAGIPCTFVWGNCDFDRAGEVARLKMSGKRIAVTHGDNPKLLRQITEANPGYDYLFVGHTHVAGEQRSGKLRIINPGALHRAARKTVAVLDLKSGTLRHIQIPV
jgi:hypothetical protein